MVMTKMNANQEIPNSEAINEGELASKFTLLEEDIISSEIDTLTVFY